MYNGSTGLQGLNSDTGVVQVYTGSTVVHGYWNSTGIHGNRRDTEYTDTGLVHVYRSILVLQE